MPPLMSLHGARSIPIKTTGHEKDHFTVILTARADGTKLKPYVVFKGKGTRLMKNLQNVPGVIVRFSKNGWMNDELTIDYLHSVIGQLAFRQRLLVGMRITVTQVKLFEQSAVGCTFTLQ